MSSSPCSRRDDDGSGVRRTCDSQASASETPRPGSQSGVRDASGNASPGGGAPAADGKSGAGGTTAAAPPGWVARRAAARGDCALEEARSGVGDGRGCTSYTAVCRGGALSVSVRKDGWQASRGGAAVTAGPASPARKAGQRRPGGRSRCGRATGEPCEGTSFAVEASSSVAEAGVEAPLWGSTGAGMSPQCGGSSAGWWCTDGTGDGTRDSDGAGCASGSVMEGTTAASSSGAEAGGASQPEVHGEGTGGAATEVEVGTRSQRGEAPTGETCAGGTAGGTGDAGGAGIACAPGSFMEDSTVEVRCDEDSGPAGASPSPECTEDGTWMQFNVEPTTAGASAMSGERALSRGVGEGPWPREDSRRRRTVAPATPAHAWP